MTTLTFSNNKVKKPYGSKENILTIHSPKSCCIEIANTISIDTGIAVNLPEKSTIHLTTKFKGQKIQTIMVQKYKGSGLHYSTNLILINTKFKKET